MNAIKDILKNAPVVFFDFDGTLVDSMGMWGRVDMTIVERHGGRVPDDFVDMLVPLSEEQAAQCFIDHGCSGTVASIMEEINELADVEYATAIEAKPGARALVETLRERGVRLGLITAATPARILPCLERNGMTGYFSLILTCDGVHLPKSDPAIYRKALEYMRASPEEAVMFDDNLVAVRAAREAGLATVGVYDDHGAKKWEEMKSAAHATLTDFSALAAAL